MAAFLAFAHHDRICVRFVAPLNDFASAAGEVHLAGDVVLRPVDDELRERIWKTRGETLQRIDPVALSAVGAWTHLLHVEVQAERFGDVSDAVPMQTRAEEVVTALRLRHGGSVQAPWGWFEFPRPIGEFGAALQPILMPGVLFSPKVPRRETFIFDDRDASEVPRLLELVAGRNRSERSLELAIRRFSGSYARGPLEDRLIDVWVALEALFAPDAWTELRFRASSRIARFIGSNQDERLVVQRFLRLSYDVRSHLVHGGDPDRFPADVQARVDRAGALSGVVDETEDVLRRALRGLLAGGRKPGAVIQALDAEMMA